MKILGVNTGHDGHICLLENGKLVFSHESEKDSGQRYAPVSTKSIIEATLKYSDDLDAVAISGWAEGHDPRNTPTDGGYLGLNFESRKYTSSRKLVQWTQCSHELSHIIASYALSPYADNKSCYVLLWEGFIGNFYRISPNLQVELLCEVMQGPGLRYAFAYGVADPTFNLRKGYSRLGDAGKMMALAAFGEVGEANAEESNILDYILNCPSPIDTLFKDELKDSIYYNRGVESQEFCNLARKLSDKIFDIFYHAVGEHIQERLPLLIAGGCGLNCEWNRMWEKSGLFDAVFVPPCTNDTGVGIGAAAATQKKLTGKVKIDWSVYSAQSFIYDMPKNSSVFLEKPLSLNDISETLLAGEIVCWVQGNCEIGPRALGNRSIIAAPFSIETTEKLNIIKQREKYRPVAPICIEEDAELYFEGCVQSKYMLSFYNVINHKLRAITHVDGTARVQTVTKEDNLVMYELLSTFKKHSGVSVLCNTSLNFKGRGFINSHSDIEIFCLQHGISSYVINQKMYEKTKAR